MRWKFIKNWKFRTKKNFVKYCQLSLKFWTKFAQLSFIVYGMKENYQNLANICQFFKVILSIFTLNLSGFFQNLLRSHEILQGFMIFYEFVWYLQTFMKVYDISQN